MSYCIESSSHSDSIITTSSGLIPCTNSSSSKSSSSQDSKPNPNISIFSSYISSDDQEAHILLKKLEEAILLQDHSSNQGAKTKDPVLDIFMSLIRLYGVKIQFFYQNIENEQYLLKGVKTVEVLHACLKRLARVLKLFPCGLIKPLGLSFILCEGLEIRDEALKISEVAFAEAIVIEKNAFNEEVLQKHIVKIVFVHLLRAKVQAQGIVPEGFDFKHSLKAFGSFVQNYGRVDSKALRSEHVIRFLQLLFGISV